MKYFLVPSCWCTLCSGILERAEYILQADKAISMEQLPEVNNGNGQSYGYVVYRTVVDLVRESTID